MKRLLKRAIGQGVLSVAETLPQIRSMLKPLGLRTTQECFGHRIVSVQLPGGKTLRLTHIEESYLAFQLFWEGGQYYEPLTRALLGNLLQPGATFLDIGAHVGFFSLTAGLCTAGIKIIAFEPNPKNFRLLQANAAANGLGNLICEPLAISDREGTAALYLTESDMSASLMKDFQAQDTKQIGSIEVRTTSVDTYFRQHGIKGPLVIKVDIEGHEPAFFRGAAETIKIWKPDIILEVLYEQDPALVAQLKSIGYRFYPITDEGLVELEAPKLVKRFPFLFLNHLVSVRPKAEIAGIFERVGQAVRGLDLLKTSKHFPRAEWPDLWPAKY